MPLEAVFLLIEGKLDNLWGIQIVEYYEAIKKNPGWTKAFYLYKHLPRSAAQTWTSAQINDSCHREHN